MPQALQPDHIDLYQMHHVERSTPWEEIWQAMEQLVREGMVLYVGSSNSAGLHIVHAQQAANQRSFMGLVSEQSLSNLKERMIELEVIPACRGYRLGLIRWSSLAGGLLAGMLDHKLDRRRSREWVQKAFKKHHTQIADYESLCREIGEEPADVALAAKALYHMLGKQQIRELIQSSSSL